MGACPSCLCRFFEKNFTARYSNNSVIMIPSFEHILKRGSYNFFARASVSLVVIAACSIRSILVCTRTIGMLPHSSSAASFHFST